MKYNNLMVDIETLGDTPDSAILAIGAIPFNFNGEIGKSLSININPNDSIKTGSVKSSTLIWWLETDPALLLQLLKNGSHRIEEALSELQVFTLLHCNDNFKIWANGPDFDLKIIEDKLMKCNLTKFWSPWNQRCVRTIKSIDSDLAKSVNNNEKHNPVEDCITQINQVIVINNKYQLGFN